MKIFSKILIVGFSLLLTNSGLYSAEVTQGVRLKPTVEFCRAYLIEHKASKGIGYQAGVDVDGNTVAPADLNAYPITLPKRIQLPVIFPREKVIQKSDPITNRDRFENSDEVRYPFIDDIPLGAVEFDLETHELWYNGAPMGNQVREHLRKDCHKVLREAEAVSVK